MRDGSGANTNFGGAGDLLAKSNAAAGQNRQSFLKFNISTAGTIGTAKLRLFGKLNATGSTNVPAGVFAVSDTGWGESAITWNNKPGAGLSALATATIRDTTGRYYEWDVTDYLKAQKAAGRTVVSFVVKTTAGSTPYAAFNSREAAANRPQLVITA